MNDLTLEQSVRDALRDAGDHAPLAPPVPLADAPTRVGMPSRRTRVLLAACVAAVAVALVFATVVVTRSDDGRVRVSSPGSTGPRAPSTVPDHTTAEVFMLLTATDDQIAAVRAALTASTDVESSSFLDHNAAYREFSAIYDCNADAALVQAIRPENLPVSFHVQTTTPDGVKRLQASLKALPGVALVTAGFRSQDYYCTAAPPTLPAAGDPPANATSAHDAVVAAFTQAWDGTNSVDQRRAAMENFPDTDRLLQEFDQARPGGTSMRVVVSDVTFLTPQRAEVLFHLEFANLSMPIDDGVAVFQDGTWKVDRETVCTMAQRVGVACAG